MLNLDVCILKENMKNGVAIVLINFKSKFIKKGRQKQIKILLKWIQLQRR